MQAEATVRVTHAPHIGIIDQGTTGTRFVVFDETATPIGDGFVGHDRSVTPPDRVEYDPNEIWECTRAAIQEGLDRARIDHQDLVALGIANQRQTTVVWDDDGTPIAPAQSWQDRRAAPLLNRLSEADRQAIERRSGLVVDPYFAGAKLAWVLDQETYRGRSLAQVAADGGVRFGTIDTWLIHRLTGNHVTDTTNAAQTLLFDQSSLDWEEATLETLSIPRETLPRVAASTDGEAFGRTNVGGLLDTEIPVTGVIGNQQAALAGHGLFELGATKVSYGSGNFVLRHVGREPTEDPGGMLATVWFHQANHSPHYGVEGPIFTTGTALEWLERLGLLPDGGQLVSPEAPIHSDTKPVVIPALGSYGAPDWPARGAGLIAQLSRYTDPDDIVRGTVDGIGFATRRVLDAMDAGQDAGTPRVAIDGGAIADDAFAARQARLLGRQLVRGAVPQTSALGAACAAGIGAGVWTDPAEFAAHTRVETTFSPDDQDVVEDEFATWERSFERFVSS